MKKLLLPLLVLFLYGSVSGQTLTLQAGTSISTSPYEISFIEENMFEEIITGYAVFVGMEYLESEMFNLSTNLGYVRKGGAENLPLTSSEYPDGTGEYEKIYMEMDYISLNTLAELNIPVDKNIYPFLSAGPRIDFYTGGNIYFEERMNDTDYGLLLGGGIKYREAGYSFGIRADYYLNFNNAAEWEFDSGETFKINNKTFTVTLTAGFELNSGKGE